MSHPFVSIVVPTRNRANLLRDCLESLLAQDYPPTRYEIIVLDDGSTDSTPDAVRAIQQRASLPEIWLISQPPGGLNAARNAGINKARGDPICFVDDDVETPSSWVSAIIDGIGRHPEAGCFGGPIRLRLEGRVPRLCHSCQLGETELDCGNAERPVAAVWGANMAVTRSALQSVGTFRADLPIYGDEQEWEGRYCAAGGVIWYVPEAWLWHRRVADDLRIGRLLRSRFSRGLNWTTSSVAMNRRASFAGALWRFSSRLAHGAVHGCVAGLLDAAFSLGTATAICRALTHGTGRSFLSWLPR